MKCESRFKTTRPLVVRIQEATYAAMEKIPSASNVRVLRTGDKDEWVQVEYDWPDDAPYFDQTDEIMAPFGLELVKDWRGEDQERLR